MQLLLNIVLFTLRFGLCTSTGGASTGGATRCVPSNINWKDCANETNTPGLQCANFSVPVDWSKPCNGDHVRLALSILPAKMKQKRIGTLFFNTGGPGGQAIPELIGNGTGLVPFSDNIRDHFDLVAMDPRGIGQS